MSITPDPNPADLHKTIRKQMEDPMRSIQEQIERSLPKIGGLGSPLISSGTFTLPEVASPEERQSYESSKELIQAIVATIRQWKVSLPAGCTPAVMAVLTSGVQIEVTRLANVSFHGVQIEGLIGKAPCVMLAHQATVQVLCYVQDDKPESPRRRIGFVIDGTETEE